MPTKFVSFPKYEYYIADYKYSLIAKRIGIKYDSREEAIEKLINKIVELNNHLGIPKSFMEYGINEELFMSRLDSLADKAFEDQCTNANPRLPLVSELKQIMIDSYYGNI